MNKIKKRVILIVMAFLLSSVLMGQSNYFVKSDASSSNNGSTWANAYTSLQSALSLVSSGDKIYVAKGTYLPSNEVGGTGDSYKTFQLVNGVAVYGGLVGNEDMSTYDLDNRDFSTNQTILSGDLGSSVFVYHVIRNEGVSLGASTILDGFTISDGKAVGSGDDAHGGGMLNNYSSGYSNPNITNCIFSNNEAALGAAVYNSRYSNPTISYSDFENNTATTLGGAVYNFRNTPVFNHCTFTLNTVLSTSETHGGGAIYSATSNAAEGPIILNCIFTDNSVNTMFGKGGAIRSRLDPGQMMVEHCTFRNNEALYGGAVYIESGNDDNRDDSDVQISDCVFEENYAVYGGAIFNDRHHSILTSCIIRGNEAAEQAGGFYSRYASSKLVNTLISGNKSSKHGGGVYYNAEAGAEIINSTISGNNSGQRGGAISIVNTTTVNIKNTILWGNTSGSGNNIYISTVCTANVDYSLYGNEAGDINIVSGGALNASNCLTSNPSFIDAIAPTGVNTPNLNGDYTLENTSLAIDAGSNALVPPVLITDLVGNNRVIDGDDNSSAVVDMGAYEYDLSEVPLPISLVKFSAERTHQGIKLT
ncbi:MAG: choice-of-anchor Q domain-containing protein [Candidatus Neomarinimicrobiota bacterium]